jgi:hypothetical protein
VAAPEAHRLPEQDLVTGKIHQHHSAQRVILHYQYSNLTAALGRNQPLDSPDIPSGECPLYPNTSRSDASI